MGIVDTQSPARMDNLTSSAAVSNGVPSGSPREAIVPFNVLETTTGDLLRAFAWVIQPDPLEALRQTLREWIQEENLFFSPSGECAVAHILSLLPQKEVVMPAWICHNVKTAAKVAGKRILYIDLAKNSINATCAQYDEVAQPGRILLIAHLFGVPTDVGAICELARRRDCVTIEDAVPAIGGRQEGRLLGTFADFGVFSFEQSKRIPAFRGGFIVAKSKHVIDLSRLDSTRVVQTTRSMPFGALAEALFHNFVTHPLIYRHLIRPLLPLRPLLRQRLNSVARKSTSPGPVQGDASAKPPSTPFYTREIHPYQAQLLIPMIRRIDRICKRISQLAELYEKHFEGRAIQTFIPVGSDTSGLMRFPIAFPGRDRSRILRLAQRRGIYLKTMWSQEAGCEGLPNCLWVARNLILLPLYSALSLTSAEAIAETLLDIELTSRSECQTTE